MKLLITLELALLFFATTFETHNTSGWYQQFLPVNCNINDMHFVDEKTGWIVSLQGHILKTTNSGDNWVVQKDSAGTLYDVQFLDLNTGYVLGNGNHGIIYRTSNGGTNWILVHDFNPAGIFKAMSFANVNTGWVVSIDAFDGGVFKTTNAGLSWANQRNVEHDNPDRVYFINKDTGWTGNFGGHLMQTTNGGTNWNLQSTLGSIKDIEFASKDTGWIAAGNQNIVKFTSNGGNNWTSQYLPPEGGNLITVRPNDFTSIDGKVVYGTLGTLFYGNSRFRGVIFKTTNAGQNWFYQLPDTSIIIGAYDRIESVSNLITWSANISLIHTTDGGGPLVGISKNENETVSSFRLNQNYPNPFNPGTKITFYLKKPGYAVLKVFDIKGGLVKVLIDNRLNSGVHETEFNADELPGGIYFYRLEMLYDSGELETGSRKMILIR